MAGNPYPQLLKRGKCHQWTAVRATLNSLVEVGVQNNTLRRGDAPDLESLFRPSAEHSLLFLNV